MKLTSSKMMIQVIVHWLYVTFVTWEFGIRIIQGCVK